MKKCDVIEKDMAEMGISTITEAMQAMDAAYSLGLVDTGKKCSAILKYLLTGETTHKVNRKQCQAACADYHAYAQTVNPHVKPIKGTSSGTWGNDLEMQVKLILGNYRFCGVADRKRPDTFKKVNGISTTFEIKSGAGELAILDRDGNKVNNELTADFIVYAPFYDPARPAGRQVYVIPADDFIDIFADAKLLRTKMSTAMTRQVKAGIITPEQAYKDRYAIQTYSNSRVKTEALMSALSGYDTLDEWVEENL